LLAWKLAVLSSCKLLSNFEEALLKCIRCSLNAVGNFSEGSKVGIPLRLKTKYLGTKLLVRNLGINIYFFILKMLKSMFFLGVKFWSLGDQKRGCKSYQGIFGNVFAKSAII
jgi:hypothetical protein